MTDINSLLEAYGKKYPEERDSIGLFRKFNSRDISLSRARRIGHFTASAWIINRAGNMALLTHHAKLDLWLQLGGHIEEGEDVHTAALREASEESGLKKLSFITRDLYDIDAHLIPERKGREEHVHFDLRFLIQADSDEPLLISSESKDLKWVYLEDVGDLNNSPSIMRMVHKTKSFV